MADRLLITRLFGRHEHGQAHQQGREGYGEGGNAMAAMKRRARGTEAAPEPRRWGDQRI